MAVWNMEKRKWMQDAVKGQDVFRVKKLRPLEKSLCLCFTVNILFLRSVVLKGPQLFLFIIFLGHDYIS